MIIRANGIVIRWFQVVTIHSNFLAKVENLQYVSYYTIIHKMVTTKGSIYPT